MVPLSLPPVRPELLRELRAEDLRWTCDPTLLPFETTDELPLLDSVLGQPRAVAAMEFGIAMGAEGYNLYALGPHGIGKRFVVGHYLEGQAKRQPPPDDWCYVFEFADSHRPRALRLPPGRAVGLRKDMDELVEVLRSSLSAAFEREDYQSRRQLIDQEMEQRHEKALEDVGKQAKERGLALLRNPMGLAVVPVRDGDLLPPEEVEKLPEEERQRLSHSVDEIRAEMEKVFRLIPRLQRERKEKVQELDREVSRTAVDAPLDDLRRKYQDLPDVLAYLDAVEEDVLHHAQLFRSREGSPASPEEAMDHEAHFRRYRVNVLVDCSNLENAPVVYEDNPTWANLLGRVEHVSQMGTLVTDFTLIKPGALHRANGGFLVIEALELLRQPFAWEGLKRALRAGQIKIEPMAQAWSLLSTVTLEPVAIPLTAKIVLTGDRMLYYLLFAYDPDFRELFKVQVDFEESLDRTQDNQLLYARLIAGLARREKLKPFDRTAVARVMENAARQVEDASKLSLHGGHLLDLLREADHACNNGRTTVTAADVQKAIDAQIFRTDRLRQHLLEEVQRGVLRVEVDGAVAGQVNGLSVLQLGGFAFGHPGRITARVRLGEGEVVDIEREVKLSGPLHSKGVLILSGFLGERYAADRPLSLTASLVFEQSYGGVEGDSASLAELCALLSAIAGIPIQQSLAMTGSVDQRGQAQPIGGVNEKIEGFFDVCQTRGLTGRQGVLIPVSNVQHLMLRHDVVDAVRLGMFHIYPVATVDEALEVLTGQPAGVPDATGVYPEGSVNRRIADRLAAMAQVRTRFLKGKERGTEE
ncbi:MAG TPA: ATP-dependent protease [Acidobacteria bacterium]|nr:ATP-dependent protease [Acidobacteriota bacterium]